MIVDLMPRADASPARSPATHARSDADRHHERLVRDQRPSFDGSTSTFGLADDLGGAAPVRMALPPCLERLLSSPPAASPADDPSASA